MPESVFSTGGKAFTAGMPRVRGERGDKSGARKGGWGGAGSCHQRSPRNPPRGVGGGVGFTRGADDLGPLPFPRLSPLPFQPRPPLCVLFASAEPTRAVGQQARDVGPVDLVHWLIRDGGDEHALLLLRPLDARAL
eukprot:365778-Chlamydomonas_euryale.AAC.10